jgi:serine/threonine-protein kinase
MGEPFTESDMRAQLVDQVCDRFEAAWAAGQRPRLEDYLGAALRSVQSVLLRELLALELACRRRRGEAPALREYLERFPEHAPTVTGAFREPSPPRQPAATPAEPVGGGEEVSAGNTTAESRPAPPAADLPAVPGHVCLEVLGKGGMGIEVDPIV